jgi:hypothetical protein
MGRKGAIAVAWEGLDTTLGEKGWGWRRWRGEELGRVVGGGPRCRYWQPDLDYAAAGERRSAGCTLREELGSAVEEEIAQSEILCMWVLQNFVKCVKSKIIIEWVIYTTIYSSGVHPYRKHMLLYHC